MMALWLSFSLNPAFATLSQLIDLADCAQIIHADFRRGRPAHKRRPVLTTGDVVAWGRTQPELRPALRPIHLTATEFLKASELRGRLPGLRTYLSAVARQEDERRDGFFEIRATAADLAGLIARGVLAWNPRAINPVDPKKTLRPNDDEVALVFRDRARLLLDARGELPVWDLRAVVTGFDVHDQAHRVLHRRFGFVPAYILRPSGWSPTGEGLAIDLPMVFDVPLNPLTTLVLADPHSEREARRTNFLEFLDPDSLPRLLSHPYELWLPYARSVFDLVTTDGKRARGRLLEVSPTGAELSFVWGREVRTFAAEDIRELRLVTYIPNRPDGRKVELGSYSLPELTEWLRGNLAPAQPLVITSDRLQLAP